MLAYHNPCIAGWFFFPYIPQLTRVNWLLLILYNFREGVELPESSQSSCHLGKLLFPKPELFGDFGENFPTKPPLDAKKGTKNQYGFFRQKNHGPHFKGGGLVFETILNGLSGFQCACVYYCVYNTYTLEVLGHHFLDRLVSEFHHYFSRDLSSSKRKHHF